MKMDKPLAAHMIRGWLFYNVHETTNPPLSNLSVQFLFYRLAVPQTSCYPLYELKWWYLPEKWSTTKKIQ